MTYDEVSQAAAAHHLTPLGGFHDSGRTTILLGPREPGFWNHVSQSAAFLAPDVDPLDNWSQAAITAVAGLTGGLAVFPFGGPPHHPFISWALKSGEAWQSPMGLLVHKDAGLLVSYRGALQFDVVFNLPVPSANPCDTCPDKPCVTACPVGAIDAQGYDVPACKAHIDTDRVCRLGCRVRMACPLSQSYGRDPVQTAFHMEAFHPS